MKNTTWGQSLLKELEAEAPATRRCLERVPEGLYDYKPHEKSMLMGYLALLMADMIRWLNVAAETGEIDFKNWERIEPKTTTERLKYFDGNLAKARQIFSKMSDEDLAKPFTLRNGDAVIWTLSRGDCVASTINHLVHHRGQLTVYLRLNDIPVPSIYGPSADEK